MFRYWEATDLQSLSSYSDGQEMTGGSWIDRAIGATLNPLPDILSYPIYRDETFNAYPCVFIPDLSGDLSGLKTEYTSDVADASILDFIFAVSLTEDFNYNRIALSGTDINDTGKTFIKQIDASGECQCNFGGSDYTFNITPLTWGVLRFTFDSVSENVRVRLNGATLTTLIGVTAPNKTLNIGSSYASDDPCAIMVGSIVIVDGTTVDYAETIETNLLETYRII